MQGKEEGNHRSEEKSQKEGSVKVLGNIPKKESGPKKRKRVKKSGAEKYQVHTSHPGRVVILNCGRLEGRQFGSTRPGESKYAPVPAWREGKCSGVSCNSCGGCTGKKKNRKKNEPQGKLPGVDLLKETIGKGRGSGI